MDWRILGTAARQLTCAGAGILSAAEVCTGLSRAGSYAGHLSASDATWILIPAVGGAYLLSLAHRYDLWRGLRWAMRSLILAMLLLVWRAHGGLDWREYLAGAGALVLALWVHYVAHRQVLGFVWIGDERQKVLHWNRGFAVFQHTTHTKRIVEEAEAKADRRRTLLLGLPGLGLAWLSFGRFQVGDSFTGVLLSLVTFAFLFPAACALFLEILYQSGWQDMQGHKVLDAEPIRAGLQIVEGQHVWGRPAHIEETEALDAAAGKRGGK